MDETSKLYTAYWADNCLSLSLSLRIITNLSFPRNSYTADSLLLIASAGKIA